ncbi:extracellular solute-binding protein [Amycolatopsis rhizosphaerae]|uniref:Extracellular solute-binding protein n=1 Tax=Amycolatopsis rhizosphaerae TaxID=2053003 RepID=A0A558A945_9PSEU|nr:extracellular solute-binding protein [Amycolatopsis rhizosphaerae]TVT20784.1 extracellular solute-binding protein [Amycolatopsis rhizosphaerae]
MSASEGALLTGFADAGQALFSTPKPGCYLYHAASVDNTKNRLQPGKDFDFFPFPKTGEASSGVNEVSADFAVLVRQTPQAKELVKFLASDAAQGIWPARPGSGALSPDRNIGLGVYPDEVSRSLARILTGAPVCLDASDLMPSSLSNAFNQAMLAFLSDPARYADPANVHALLANLDKVAAQAYPGNRTLNYHCGQF